MPRRIRRRRLDGWIAPHLLFRALYSEAAHAVWLDGGSDASSGLSIMAAAHAGSEFVTADVAAGTVSPGRPAASDRPRTTAATVDEVLAVLGERLGGEPVDEYDGGERADGPGALLGWYGWFGYEFGARVVGVPAAATDAPDAAWLWVDRAVVFDHAERSADLVWLDESDGGDDRGADRGAGSAEDWAEEVLDVWSRLAEGAFPDLPPDGPSADPSSGEPAAPSAEQAAPEVRWRHAPRQYAALIAECQRAIRRGDAYQLCLTNRIDVDAAPDPASAYLALRASSPSHHGGYLRFGDHALLSASPELFLHVTPDGVVSTKPMKGTRPRHTDAAHDERLRRELLASDKERAENLMIVDLMRNDLGRVAELGSVEVPSLLAVEEYPHVHQLVSTVRARLRHPLTSLDAVEASFPAGSMTGAPKHSAMRILHELEGGPRGVYSGAFGYLAIDGAVDLAMVIRSIVLGPSGASIGTGGGITALSVAEEEIEETRVKARALLAILGAAGAQPE
ncbi:anthranilate synthase component I family protein [Agromyces terreus]|uniref:anthranilate synthase component I family protein n=1 Tax=Agromyces terreus TaxID=424795 RepID=UPI0031D3FEFF